MKDLIVLDCEIYPNYSLFAFKNIDNKKVVTIEMKGEDACLNDDQLRKLNTIMQNRTTFGFNSRNYDMPIILYAFRRKTCLELYKMSCRIIENSIPGWKTLNDFGIVWPKSINHFDIQECAPGVRISLKLYGGRMHSKRLQDLPIEPGSTLSDKDMSDIKNYCINDLDTTIDLYNSVKDRIMLRVNMSKQYGQDLMSKSDAQIAEAVIKSQLNSSNKKMYAPSIPENATFKYDIPDYISFESPQLQETLETIRHHDFELDAKGSIKLPSKLKKKIKLGHSTYQLGIGGIHSTEKSQTVIPDENQILVDKDVSAYYPSIILNLGLYPRHLGPRFLDVYRDIVETRLEAKRAKNKVVNESLKIVINGSFGKLGSKYSALYSPDLMMTVTLTGQLVLLMLIEQLEKHDISVVSANTDGFVSLIDKDRYELYDDICFDWELKTGFELEETRYRALYSRDVNNYLAIIDSDDANDTSKTKTKGKGLFALDSLTKNPQASICIIAVRNLLVKGKPLADTIKSYCELTKFLHVRSVTGGAVFREKYLGRVVRWIYSTKGDTIRYKKNGNKVAKSDASRPIMEFDGSLPDDIDFNRYIDEATSILDDIGLTKL